MIYKRIASSTEFSPTKLNKDSSIWLENTLLSMGEVGIEAISDIVERTPLGEIGNTIKKLGRRPSSKTNTSSTQRNFRAKRDLQAAMNDIQATHVKASIEAAEKEIAQRQQDLNLRRLKLQAKQTALYQIIHQMPVVRSQITEASQKCDLKDQWFKTFQTTVYPTLESIEALREIYLEIEDTKSKLTLDDAMLRTTSNIVYEQSIDCVIEALKLDKEQDAINTMATSLIGPRMSLQSFSIN